MVGNIGWPSCYMYIYICIYADMTIITFIVVHGIHDNHNIHTSCVTLLHACMHAGTHTQNTGECQYIRNCIHT